MKHLYLICYECPNTRIMSHTVYGRIKEILQAYNNGTYKLRAISKLPKKYLYERFKDTENV